MKNTGIVIFQVFVALFASELLLRLFGYAPLSGYSDPSISAELTEVAADFGWRNKEGQGVIQLPSAEKSYSYSNWEDGGRATRFNYEKSGKRVVLVGCSAMYGWGLSDSDTFAWKLQQLFPELDIRNHAVTGYSSLQALMTMELFRTKAYQQGRGNHSQEVVLYLYGMIDHHEDRNVGTAAWQEVLARNTSSGNISMPYCRVAKGCERQLNRSFYPEVPLADRLVIASLLKKIYAQFGVRGQEDKKRVATEMLLQEMQQEAERQGARLLIVGLSMSEESVAHYQSFLQKKNIEFKNCTHPQATDPGFQIPGDGHPNELVQDYWIACLQDNIRALTLEQKIS